jgi:hypothetical protein
VTLEAWIGSRRPPVPGDFAEWVRPDHPDAPACAAALVREARVAFARASAPEARPRGGAFDLLAADGFATWACEAALDEADPDAALRGVLDALME